MSERVESFENKCAMLVELCQVDSASAGPPLLPMFVPDVVTGLSGIESSPSKLTSAVSGLPNSAGVVKISDGEVDYVSVGKSCAGEVSGVVVPGIGVSAVPGANIREPVPSVAAVAGKSGRLVSVDRLGVKSVEGLCGAIDLGSQVCLSDHRPVFVDYDLSIGMTKSGLCGKVGDALVSGTPMVMCEEGVRPAAFTGNQGCDVLFRSCEFSTVTDMMYVLCCVPFVFCCSPL